MLRDEASAVRAGHETNKEGSQENKMSNVQGIMVGPLKVEGPEPEARHRAAARAYDSSPKALYTWAPVWDGGAKFVLHAWPSRFNGTMRETVCGLPTTLSSTFAMDGCEPRCEKCWDGTLDSLARAFAKLEHDVTLHE